MLSCIVRRVEKKTTVSVTFEAPRDLAKKLEAEAKEAERPRSWVIRRLLLRALAENDKTV